MRRRTLFTFALAAVAAAGPIAATSAVAEPRGSTILETAVAANTSGPLAGQLDTLIAAVSRPDMAPIAAALDGNRQLTVFAPVDTAFEAIGVTPATVTGIPADTLSNILLYHVTPGRRIAASVLGAPQVRMLNGEKAVVDAAAGTIDGASIIATDVKASNGIIHVVAGTPLLP